MDIDRMTSDWFYSRPGAGDGNVGPVDWGQLVAAARSGHLSPHDLVWHPTLTEWSPAGQIPGLFPMQSPAGSGDGRRSRLLLAIGIPVAAAVVVAGLVLGLYFGLRDGDGTREAGTSGGTTEAGVVGPTSSDTTISTAGAAPGTWLVMMYEDADDEILEEDIAFDLNEAELVGSTDQVTIVAQMDRYVGGYAGDGDVTSTKRYLVTNDADVRVTNSEELADLGEADMGDIQTLYDFATWAITTYPADHHVLIMADHGSGWVGGWSDDDPLEGSGLSMEEIDVALGAVVADTGIGSFELVGFDACLMGQLEVMSAIAPHASYAVASEEIEPSVGWSYAGFLRDLTENPGWTGRELGQAIVDTYISSDIRVTDDQERELLAGPGVSADAVAASLGEESTLSVIDLGRMQELVGAVNGLSAALAGVDQGSVARARTYAQGFTNVFSQDSSSSFIDLGHFVDLLLEDVADTAVIQAAQQVKSALATAVVAEQHGEARPASTGLSIYFPNSTEYAGTFAGDVVDYPSAVGRFTAASAWDNFLTFHYTGKEMAVTTADPSLVTPAAAAQTGFASAIAEAAPEQGAFIVGPGSGGLTIAPIYVSADRIGPDDTVTLSTEITGSNIAYVYYYVSYYWEEDGSYLSADQGFIESGYVKEMGGVYYPDWGDSETTAVEFYWEPTLYYMSDGNDAHDQFAFFQPTVYGAEAGEDIYTVRGTYTYADTGTQIDAEIDFDGNGDMRGVWGFVADDDGSGAGVWHEITPAWGDMFTITHEYLEFDEDPEGIFVDYDGGTMTFGDTPFIMVPYYADAGDYVLAIGVEDLDGNLVWEFADVTVTE